MQTQSFGYFGLQGAVNVNQFLPNPLVVEAIQILSKNQKEIQHLHDRVFSDMIAKAIEGSITNTSLKKLGLNKRECE